MLGHFTTWLTESFAAGRTWLESKLILVAVALLWGSMIVICSPIQIPFSLWAMRTNRRGIQDLCYSFWMIQDQACNMILSGHHETTVSAMIGYYSQSGSKTAASMRVLVDYLFKKISGQLNHCVGAVENHDTFRFNRRYAAVGFCCYWANLFIIYKVIT